MRLPIYKPYPVPTTADEDTPPATTTADDGDEWNDDDVIELA